MKNTSMVVLYLLSLKREMNLYPSKLRAKYILFCLDFLLWTSPQDFKKRLLGRGFHIFICSFSSPTNVGFQVPLFLGGQRPCWHTARCLVLILFLLAVGLGCHIWYQSQALVGIGLDSHHSKRIIKP